MDLSTLTLAVGRNFKGTIHITEVRLSETTNPRLKMAEEKFLHVRLDFEAESVVNVAKT